VVFVTQKGARKTLRGGGEGRGVVGTKGEGIAQREKIFVVFSIVGEMV